jgi:Zn-dependent protease with chaperone function
MARNLAGPMRILTVVTVFGGLLLPAESPAQPPRKTDGTIPSAPEVNELLRREPMTVDNWPAWRRRLLTWIGDRSSNTNAAYEAARTLMRGQAADREELPPALAQDAFAWYMLGSAYLHASGQNGDQGVAAARAERACRRSLRLDPSFGRAHRNLAMALLLQSNAGAPPRDDLGPPDPKQQEARKELDEARRLDPSLPLKEIEAEVAARQKRFAEAQRLYEQALAEEPDNLNAARGVAASILMNRLWTAPRGPAIKPLVDRFPDDGVLVCLHAVALSADGNERAGARELDRARKLGTDPTTVLRPQIVREIEEQGAPGVFERFAWFLLYFTGFYASVMALMALAGLVLAGRTRGSRALNLLGVAPDELVTEGQVVRSQHESSVAKLYMLTLMLGLVLFYAAIPFVVAGLLAATGLLLYLIFHAGRIPIKLVVPIVVGGGGMAWAVLKSVFARPGQGGFGLQKTAADCPRLHTTLAEVARRVDTDPVDQVYVAPGSAIGVHREGRGPFGIFGVKRRVLTLGLSTMRFLTVSELQSILAHEYAHFSHRDTFYSRFIYQVTMSIEQALEGMGQSGGRLNYVNPFFWFLYLYHKSYGLLAAGFSRSREFLADRMAASLYGSDVFGSALSKVCTDGTLFEMTIYGKINQLLEQDKAFINMYEAFRAYRDEQLSAQDRDELYRKLLEEKESLFASHPTFRERIEAVASLPRATHPDATPALELFENKEEVEKELTEFLTAYLYHVHQLQAQAAAAQ